MAPISSFIERPRAFCALGGAVMTVTALPGAVPILHSALGCGGSIYYNQYGSTGYLGAGFCGGMSVPSSNVGEQEIVFGGVDRLDEQVRNTLKIVDGDLYVIVTGCTTDMIGDDIQSVVRDYADQAPIIGVETGGFRGDGYKGYDLVLQGLFRHYVERQDATDPLSINLWGIVPGQDVFWRGNLHNLKLSLEKLGLRVNTFFTDGATLDDLRQAGRAALNVVVSPRYGVTAAGVFEEVHGTPYLTTALPIGPSAMARFLREVSARLGLDAARVDAVVAAEERDYYFFIDRLADTYNDLDLQRYAVVVGDANYATALTRFLANDLGWLPSLTVITDDLYEDEQAHYHEELAALTSGVTPRLVFETDASEINRHFAKMWPRNRGQKFYHAFSPAFVVGSHLEREFAKNIGAAHLSVTYPIGNRVVIDRAYAGYHGALTLIEDLFGVIVAER